MKRYINFEAVLEGSFCLVFSGLMFYMAYSGKYLLFVTPKMKPYLYFTAMILLIWAISRLKQAGKPKYRVHLSKCLVLVIPLMVMLLPYKAMAAGSPKAQYSNVAGAAGSAGTLNKKTGKQPSGGSEQNVQMQQYTGSGQNSSQNSGNQQTAGSGQSSGHSQPGSKLNTKVPSGLDASNHSIVVSDKEFYQWLVELSQHQDKYEGYTIQMHGTIYHDQTLGENEFAVTRVLMSCCVADLADCGPICEYQGAAGLEAGKWVTVTGTVHFDKTKGIEIIVSQIQDAQPAAEQYVYPFSY